MRTNCQPGTPNKRMPRAEILSIPLLPWSTDWRLYLYACVLQSPFTPRKRLDQSLASAHTQVLHWKMAGSSETLKMEPLGGADEAEEAEGQAKSLKTTDDLLAMVAKLQKEGSLEPQIEDLIHRINALQQAKRKASEEVGEALALWEALHRELDSMNVEKVHLEEILSKKQETLRILHLHCQKDHAGQRVDVEEQLEELMGQHKDLWEFHMLEQRLIREMGALECSKAQLLTDETVVRAKLEEVGRRLHSPLEVQEALAWNNQPLLQNPETTAFRLPAELELVQHQVPAQAQAAPEDEACKGETWVEVRVQSQIPTGQDLLPSAVCENNGEPPLELALLPPKPPGSPSQSLPGNKGPHFLG
ncbi:PREDICTED: synaptonemal complex central element protein 1-like [Chrysochloris asiatica]|uniref:Synaptonemal complex central element protein 1-like n=1 Tax=Chrysochloris asiatica TaxID=185453 RepID=A0A9B0T9E7_CHRAS|nr:PREDICTED: synaptonemal complex central element protein 1-like [Chrysochloris asiatica]